MSIIINEKVDLKDGNSVASGLFLSYTGIYAFREQREKVEVNVGSVDTANNIITLTGVDLTDKIQQGSLIIIKNSTANDGNYSVSSSLLNGSDTEITVNENISDGTNDGVVKYDNFEFVLEVGVIGFVNKSFFNKYVGNEAFSLKLDHSSVKPIKQNYRWDILVSEYKTGQFNDLVDSKLKAELESSGYTPLNVVID